MPDDAQSPDLPPETDAPEGPLPETPPQKSAEDMASEALETVSQAAEALGAATVTPAAGEHAMDLPDFGDETALAGDEETERLSFLNDVSLRVTVELGRTRMYVADVLRLDTDSVIELDKAAGDPVDIFVNDQHVARGEVLVLDENFCIRVSEILQVSASEEGPTDD